MIHQDNLWIAEICIMKCLKPRAVTYDRRHAHKKQRPPSVNYRQNAHCDPKSTISFGNSAIKGQLIWKASSTVFTWTKKWTKCFSISALKIYCSKIVLSWVRAPLNFSRMLLYLHHRNSKIFFHPAKFDNFKDEKIADFKTVSRRFLLVCHNISDVICDINSSHVCFCFLEGGQENILIGRKYFLDQ